MKVHICSLGKSFIQKSKEAKYAQRGGNDKVRYCDHDRDVNVEADGDADDELCVSAPADVGAAGA